MFTQYSMIRKTYTMENKEYIGYGIACQGETEVFLLEDISCNADAVLLLIDRCNSFSLSPLHLSDVVEDFILEISLQL